MTTPKGLDNGLTNYGDRDFARFLRRSFARSMGLSRDAAEQAGGRHRHDALGVQQLPSRHAGARRGGVARGAGGRGAAAAFPTVSLGEVFLNPTSMVYRNLMAMDTEEMIRRPADGRGRADRRLRQDRARPADGRGLGGPSRDPARHGPDVDRAPPRSAARRLHGLPGLLGQVPRRHGRFRRDRRSSRDGSPSPPAPAP